MGYLIEKLFNDGTDIYSVCYVKHDISEYHYAKNVFIKRKFILISNDSNNNTTELNELNELNRTKTKSIQT